MNRLKLAGQANNSQNYKLRVKSEIICDSYSVPINSDNSAIPNFSRDGDSIFYCPPKTQQRRS